MTTLHTDPDYARSTGWVKRLGAWLQTRRHARDTRNALDRLSERELTDIGLCRADIEAVVRRLF